jgi:fimbrial chaperone protein
MPMKPGNIALAGLLWLAAAQPVLRAGSFRVAPVRIDLSARRPYATLKVANADSERVTVQVDAYLWQIQGGADQYPETDDILANPPVFTLDPGATQLVRLGLRQPTPSGVERSYRVILEEVPHEAPNGWRGIQTLLRISIPLFIQSDTAGGADLVWLASRQAGGQLLLSVENRGNTHALLRQFNVVADGGSEQDLVVPTPTYVLPGSKREWTLEGARVSGARKLLVRGQADGGDWYATVAVGLP